MDVQLVCDVPGDRFSHRVADITRGIQHRMVLVTNFIVFLKSIFFPLLLLYFTECKVWMLYEPRCEKTGLRGFRSGPTQTRLYSYRRWLEA